MRKFSVFLDFLSETVEIIIAKSRIRSPLSLSKKPLSLSKNPQTLSLCPRGSEHKQKKKKMGTLCGLTVTTILLFFLLFVSLSHSFYLPGVAPRDFQTVCSLIIQTHFSKSVLYFILSLLIACFPV